MTACRRLRMRRTVLKMMAIVWQTCREQSALMQSGRPLFHESASRAGRGKVDAHTPRGGGALSALDRYALSYTQHRPLAEI